MKDVSSITLVFENCERITIPRKYIGIIHIEDINVEIARVACNSIARITSADTIALEIFSEGNVEHKPFGISQSPTEMVFSRIDECHDITAVDVTYTDGSSESFWTNYEAGSEDGLGAPNIFEKTMVSALGNLYIVIAEGKDIWDFFDEGDINDTDGMKFIKDMLGVWEGYDDDVGTDT